MDLGGPQVLKDRVALVSGAESGIGAACAIALAKAGASVAILYFSDSDLANETVKRAGARALAFACDVDRKSVV